MKGLKRSVLGGESLFVTTFTAPAGGRVGRRRPPPRGRHHRGRHPARSADVVTQGLLAGLPPASSSTPSGAGSRTCSAARAASWSTPPARARSCSPATAPSTPSAWPRASGSPSTPATWWPSRQRPEPDPQGGHRHDADPQVGRGLRVRLRRPGLGDDPDPQPERARTPGSARSCPARRAAPPGPRGVLGGLLGGGGCTAPSPARRASVGDRRAPAWPGRGRPRPR